MTDRELMQMALDAMKAVSVDEHLCNAAHHAKKDRHGINEPCPIAKRFNDTTEALRAALATKQDDGYCQACDGDSCTAKNGCVALDNLIAQPEPEPDIEAMAEAVHDAYLTTCDALGWGVKSENRVPYAELTEDSKELDRASVRAVLKFTAPPQREWQGLTDEEIMDACSAVWASHPIEVGRVVEAKLKEKNGGQ